MAWGRVSNYLSVFFFRFCIGFFQDIRVVQKQKKGKKEGFSGHQKQEQVDASGGEYWQDMLYAIVCGR